MCIVLMVLPVMAINLIVSSTTPKVRSSSALNCVWTCFLNFVEVLSIIMLFLRW
jgi:hypothetical protein